GALGVSFRGRALGGSICRAEQGATLLRGSWTVTGACHVAEVRRDHVHSLGLEGDRRLAVEEPFREPQRLGARGRRPATWPSGGLCAQPQTAGGGGAARRRGRRRGCPSTRQPSAWADWPPAFRSFGRRRWQTRSGQRLVPEQAKLCERPRWGSV